MVRDPREIERGAFDAALCLDVLEHVPDPGDIVEQLAGCLRPRGRLIVSAPFYLVSPRWATHLESNRRYSGNARLYTRRGLTLVDGRLGWDPAVFARRPFGEAVRRASAAKRFALRVSGLAMVSACVWSAPVNWFVDAVWRNNRRWLEGLEP
jgi:SAM-dependent methyltransferase